MGAKLKDYDAKLADRLERTRKKHNLTQEQMAAEMGVEIGQYKRYIYKKAKVPAEKLAILIQNLNLDTDYMLYGSTSSNYRFVKILGTASNAELSELYGEIARLFREKDKAEHKVDYIVNESTVLETHIGRKQN